MASRTNPTQEPADAQTAPATRKTDPEAQVAERVNAEQEQGFRGVAADPTPNENYTVAGVTSGAPTPETDEDAAAAAREHADKLRTLDDPAK